MRFTFLGTGSAIPTERVQSGIVLHEARLLVDCGSGVLHNLVRSPVGVGDVEAVLLTHCHLDHTSDLMSLVKAHWLFGRAELEVYGPPGTYETVEGLFDAYAYMRGRLDIEVVEVDPGASFEVEGLSVETLPTEHSVESMAYRFEDDLVVSGDTEPVPEMTEFATGCAVLVHECSFPDEMEMDNHTVPSTLAPLLDGCEVGRVYLTHLYPQTEGHEEEMLRTVSERFHGEVEIARDLVTVDTSEARE